MSATIFATIEQLKHCLNTAKTNHKDKHSDLRNIYIICRPGGRVYMAACDGHHAPIYLYNGNRGEESRAYCLSFENAQALASFKTDKPAMAVELGEECATFQHGSLTMQAPKIEHCYIVPILENFEQVTKYRKLVASPAMHFIRAEQLKNIFPGKTGLEILQEAGKPEKPQLCISTDFPNFMALLMAFRINPREYGKAIKQARAFFTD